MKFADAFNEMVKYGWVGALSNPGIPGAIGTAARKGDVPMHFIHKDGDGQRKEWKPSCEDLLRSDWEIVYN